jgi:twitching motility protein PilT
MDEPEQTMRTILVSSRDQGASEIHMAVNTPVVFRMPDGRLARQPMEPLSLERLEALSLSLLTPAQRDFFWRERDSDTSYFIEGVGNFRVNLSCNRGTVGASIRVLPPVPRTIRELHLPGMLEEIACLDKGLVLITGGASEGKSTTLAGMIQYLNTSALDRTKDRRHIITIENPIEHTFESRNALIRQREVGRDVVSFPRAIAAATREDVDVIAIGEMRDAESAEAAIQAAIRGPLVISTTQAHSIDEVPTLFPQARRRSLAFALKAVVCQELLPCVKGGKVACCQILMITHGIANTIMGDEVHHKLSSFFGHARPEHVTRMSDCAKALNQHYDKTTGLPDPLISDATLRSVVERYKGH